uniref:Uncharacterized protein n=1 Tax=Streptomyces sp. NBC_00003 TaxID=2903608 RepID=A0AAU2V6Q8_9ACTN
MVGTPAAAKWKDQENGVRAMDRDTEQPMFTLTLFLMEDERAEALKIAIPSGGLPNGLHPGRFVKPVNLFAIPWARIVFDKDGKPNLQEGVAYRCAALELVEAPAVPQEAAA